MFILLRLGILLRSIDGIALFNNPIFQLFFINLIKNIFNNKFLTLEFSNFNFFSFFTILIFNKLDFKESYSEINFYYKFFNFTFIFYDIILK
jgi:hypothetical protein